MKEDSSSIVNLFHTRMQDYAIGDIIIFLTYNDNKTGYPYIQKLSWTLILNLM